MVPVKRARMVPSPGLAMQQASSYGDMRVSFLTRTQPEARFGIYSWLKGLHRLDGFSVRGLVVLRRGIRIQSAAQPRSNSTSVIAGISML
jgi:cytochrome b561